MAISNICTRFVVFFTREGYTRRGGAIHEVLQYSIYGRKNIFFGTGKNYAPSVGGGVGGGGGGGICARVAIFVGAVIYEAVAVWVLYSKHRKIL